MALRTGTGLTQVPSIYIINPATNGPGYYTGEAFSHADRRYVWVADLSVATVAGFVPREWDIRIADESIAPADLDAAVDFVAITGKVTQRTRMIELAREFRRRGRTVLIGGSFATLTPDDMRPHADILVTGEIEEIAPRLFADLASGQWEDSYDGGMADITRTPLPRWDLYPSGQALQGALQTTRGCPFSCEFCDVIEYQGRKQRHKTVDQVIAELDLLYSTGFRQVFLVDDNFTVHRRWAHTVVDALAAWNARHADDPVTFATQASIDLARDEELMAKCVAAGLSSVFVGVETINENSLRETGKRQNLLAPMLEAVRTIVSHGIALDAGIIVGFDHDDATIFGRLSEFFQESPLPVLTIGLLTAPRATGLFRRLLAEGRLSGEVWDTGASVLTTNIVPARMSKEALLSGALRLCRTTYDPEQFEQRVFNFIDVFDGAPAMRRKAARLGETGQAFGHLLGGISARGPAEAAMIRNVLHAAAAKPATLPHVISFLCRYAQARLVLDRAESDRTVEFA
ncbi:MAG TPA: radical SAM protein [Stellaceae bacterium]|nr:radical SAM protein [Stellaceae bacterium]